MYVKTYIYICSSGYSIYNTLSIDVLYIFYPGAPCMEYLPTLIPSISAIHVGKYSSPVDPMGMCLELKPPIFGKNGPIKWKVNPPKKRSVGFYTVYVVCIFVMFLSNYSDLFHLFQPRGEKQKVLLPRKTSPCQSFKGSTCCISNSVRIH